MSWTPEAVMIRGFKVPRNIWNEGMDKCEETNCVEDWEDYFIDMDPACGQGDTFLAKSSQLLKKEPLKVVTILIFL
jgi:hypothetical protein